MEWTKVESTQIDEVGYEPETQTIGIRFLPSKTQPGEVKAFADAAQVYLYHDTVTLGAVIYEYIDISKFQEYKMGTESAITASLKVLKPELVRRQEAEAQQAELATLRAEAAARAEQERIAGLVKQALEAERQRAESERVLMEQRTQPAERRAEEAVSQAKRDQEQAVENERMRAAVEVKRKREAAEARAADNEALGAILALDIPMDRAQDLLIAISKGLIPHVSIQY
jgi:hypothetical protein